MNQVRQVYFGRGLVTTTEDFGTQGADRPIPKGVNHGKVEARTVWFQPRRGDIVIARVARPGNRRLYANRQPQRGGIVIARVARPGDPISREGSLNPIEPHRGVISRSGASPGNLRTQPQT